jgi:hypothetical protein
MQSTSDYDQTMSPGGWTLQGQEPAKSLALRHLDPALVGTEPVVRLCRCVTVSLCRCAVARNILLKATANIHE